MLSVRAELPAERKLAVALLAIAAIFSAAALLGATPPPRATRAGATAKMRGVFANAAALNFDEKLDFGALSSAIDVELRDASTKDELVDGMLGRDLVISKAFSLPASTIAELPDSVVAIVEAGTGYNNIDCAAARRKGIAVMNVPHYSEQAVAQLVITFVLAQASQLQAQQKLLADGARSAEWTERVQGLPLAEVAGKTIGLVGGNGNIGSAVASLAAALGMKVLIYSRHARPQRGGASNARSLGDLLDRSDFVSLHVPLTDATRHLIDAAALRRMKPTAYLINTARGEVIDESALLEALEGGRIAGAALDVTTHEPPAAASKLYTLPNVLLTPHVGWKRVETRQRLLDSVVEIVRKFAAGEPINEVCAGA